MSPIRPASSVALLVCALTVAALSLPLRIVCAGEVVEQPTELQAPSSAAGHRLEDILNFNFANVNAKARVVFVSSGPLATGSKMIDDDPSTAFRFNASDPQPTVIVELSELERLHRVSALYKMEAGRLDVFVMQQLGAKSSELESAKLVASIADADGDGQATMDFDPAGARYVAFRWTPAHPGSNRRFALAEISAFGVMPLSMLTANDNADAYASNSDSLLVAPVEPPIIALAGQ